MAIRYFRHNYNPLEGLMEIGHLYVILCFFAGLLASNFKEAIVYYILITTLFYGTGLL